MANIVHNQCKLLVSSFVEKPNWPRELKIARKLLINYSLDFLLTIPVSRLYSLSFFLTEDGKEKIGYAEKLQKLEF